MNNKPFQTKHTWIRCKNCNVTLFDVYGVTYAKLKIHYVRQNLFNPKWVDGSGNKFPLDEQDQTLVPHLNQKHKIELIRN